MNVLLSDIEVAIQDKNATEILYYILDNFGDSLALASSLGAEDQVLTDMILSYKPDTTIFTLDTGRLHPETYQLIEKTNLRYGIYITVYFPDTKRIEELTRSKGMFSFYESVEARKECCAIRKTEPLRRALEGLIIWITGLRREQAITRQSMKLLEWDETHNLIKYNPLIEWSEDDVWSYIHEHNVPYNKLHDKGFPSIGCVPCTRAVKEGEDIRSGRWWWENPEHKECGLHR